MAVEFLGIDHIYLSVSDFSRSEEFYDHALRALGFHRGDSPIGGEPHRHYYCRQFQLSIRPARRELVHDPYAPGLHHVCMRVSDKAAVDAAAEALKAAGVAIEGPKPWPEYAPDYYALFFSDPDGIRLEIVNYFERRKTLHTRWDELEAFENPLDHLLAKKS
jgi:catechol 2,3-dioxygenase-like lactoylglutathione lyase family enzyme